MDRGDMGQAEVKLRSVIEAHPDWTKPRVLLVRAVRGQGRITEAEEILQRAVEMGLDFEEAWHEHSSNHSSCRAIANPN